MKPRFYAFLAIISSIFISLHAEACAPLKNPCTIYDFRGKVTGGLAAGGVILGQKGTLYGETVNGGTFPCTATHGESGYGCGTVYSLSKVGGYKVLVSFHGPNGAFGASTLTLIGNTLYGTTERGGSGQNGVIFAVNTDGSNFTLLHQFFGPDGSNPIGPLVSGPNGILYGITGAGGPGFPGQNPGVLFSIGLNGKYTILHKFSESNGENPNTLVMTPSGILVGGTNIGGPTDPNYCPQGCGVVFSFDPSTSQYSVLKSYVGGTGGDPYIGSAGPDDTIYGNDEDLFSITLSGNYQVLAISNFYISGNTPASGPILAPNGKIFGTYTQSLGGGTVYSYDPSNPGVLNASCNFGSAGSRAGTTPASQPILAPNGDLVGTTEETGNNPVSGAIYDCTP